MIDEKEIIAKTRRTGLLHSFLIVAVSKGDGRWIAKLGAADVIDQVTESKIIAEQGADLLKKEALVFFPDLNPEKCINQE